MTGELVAYTLAGLGIVLGVSGYYLAWRWARDCRKCRILIARKGKVVLDATLVEWLAWNKALPHRERARGGIIFHANGIQVALARPKIGAPSATTKTRTLKGDAKPAPPVEVIGGRP